MTSLQLTLEDIPSLEGKVVVLTGGASGIGLAASRIFAHKGAQVHVLDIVPIDESFDIYEIPGQPNGHFPQPTLSSAGSIQFRQCDVTDWNCLRDIFLSFKHIDIVVANAGVSQDPDYFSDILDENGQLNEPAHRVVEVNFRSVLNLTKLALRQFQQQNPGSSLVITTSSTAYSPEQSLPIYSATKAAVHSLIAARTSTDGGNLRSTINGVAPAATISKLLPGNLAAPIKAAGAPISSAFHVGLAVVYAAVAQQMRSVEMYGRDDPAKAASPGRWNGRVIVTLVTGGPRWRSRLQLRAGSGLGNITRRRPQCNKS
ncbi:short chain dehydrogenase [Aspergillus sclerotialis]|uniref:Short chain dehydrogenase n=1 Tax=Aspergillus sclerotialis TaxID=2070753 RepID=A0A3A2ZK98_9EURO|nr:short chain dehydrogenase [Aspergillus sclerotialis]